MRHAGVDLPNGTDYTPWHAGLSENFVNVEDGVADAYAMWDAGTVPFIHVMYHPIRQPGCTIGKIAAGDYDHLEDAWIDTLAAYCDTGRTAVVVYLPEMNGNWTVYADDNYSTAAFKDAYRRFVDKGRTVGGDVLWCWAPNDTGWETLADWWPGDEYVDLVGGSCFNWGGIFPNEPWETLTVLADRYVREVRGFTDKPIIVTQTGAGHRDSRSPAWLDDAVFYTTNYDNIQGFIYYNELMFEWPGRDDFNQRMQPLDAVRPDDWFEEDTMHTSLLWLPQALRAAGVNVIELEGWGQAQGDYLWTDIDTGVRSYGGDPTCYMIHHTGGVTANPTVGGPGGWSKANCWAGLWRNGRLHQTGGGVPTVIFTAAGPARISSGYGHGPTLHQIADDVRVPWDQPNADTGMAANRYAWNVETVHAGDGSPIDPGVEHAVTVMGALLCERYGWSPWRTVGHLTWTRRKIDPWWDGRRDVIVRIQDTVAAMMNQTPGGDMDYRTVKNVPDAQWARNVVDTMLCLGVISEGDGSDWEKPLKNGTIWNYLHRYTTAIQRDTIDDC